MTGRRRAAGKLPSAIARAQRRWQEYARRIAASTTPIEELNAGFDLLRATAAGRPGPETDEHVRAAAAEMVARARHLGGVRHDLCA